MVHMMDVTRGEWNWQLAGSVVAGAVAGVIRVSFLPKRKRTGRAYVQAVGAGVLAPAVAWAAGRAMLARQDG